MIMQELFGDGFNADPIYIVVYLMGHPYITSAYFWFFLDHLISIDIALNVSKNGHSVDPPTQSFVDVI